MSSTYLDIAAEDVEEPPSPTLPWHTANVKSEVGTRQAINIKPEVHVNIKPEVVTYQHQARGRYMSTSSQRWVHVNIKPEVGTRHTNNIKTDICMFMSTTSQRHLHVNIKSEESKCQHQAIGGYM